MDNFLNFSYKICYLKEDDRYPESERKIALPTSLGTVVSTYKDLVTKIYFDIANLIYKSMDWQCERTKFTVKNDKAAEINDILLNLF